MKPHSSEFLKKEFSAGCQPRYPVKIPITTWKSLSPPRGLQLSPSCQARCPVKTSNEMENYPAPSAAQLLTMLLHREHFCSYLYYTQFNKKINLFLICKISIKMSTLNSTFFHVFIVLPFCTIRSPFYCIFSLLGSAVVRLPLLPASHAPCIRCYASCFTSSLNNSPAEW